VRKVGYRFNIEQVTAPSNGHGRPSSSTLTLTSSRGS
jgi:hypothetical protein